MQPGEEALNPPSSLITTKSSTILSWLLSVGPMRCNKLYPALFAKPCVELIAVVGLVPDQIPRLLFNEALVQCLFNERHFVRRSAINPGCERKTMAVCNCHDLGPLSALRFSNCGPPFLAPVKVPSMNASLGSNPPRSCRSFASARRRLSKLPSRTQRWNRRWQVWYDGYRSGRSFHGAPVRRIQRMPFSTSRGSRHGRPRRSFRTFSGGRSGAITSHWASVRSILLQCQSRYRMDIKIVYRTRFFSHKVEKWGR